MSGLSLSLLGPFTASLNNRPIDKFRTQRAQALLAYLAVEGTLGMGAHRREALMELLWPGVLPKSARNSLRQTLHYVRQAVPNGPAKDGDDPVPLFLSDRYWVEINPAYPFALDVGQFVNILEGPQDQWPEALDLYRDDFLTDLYLPDANPFEEWAAARRAAFRRQFLDALDVLAESRLQAGDYDAAENYSRRQLEFDPMRESAYRQLMRLYAWNGRGAEALSLYNECVHILEDELGAVPDAETTALYEAIREQRLPPPQEYLPGELLPEFEIPPSPYRGLFSFREEDAPYFFGRETFTEQLVEAATRQPLVAVTGASGSGKSSVLSAGLVAQLRPDETWAIATFRPGADPFQALSVALLPLLEPKMTEIDRLVEARKLATAMGQGQLPFDDVVRRVIEKEADLNRLLLVADQFEELFTLCLDLNIRQRFLDLLLEAIDNQQRRPAQSFSFVLALRVDFLEQAIAYRPLADRLQDAALLLGPMTRDELGQVIEKPAENQGVTFESGLVERILNDVGAEPGNLPLLEFALAALWEQQSERQMTHDAYEEIGGVEGALAGYAEEVYEGLDLDSQEEARRVFVQMIRPGKQAADTRRLAYKAELGEGGWDLVQRLADARLVVTGRDPAGQEKVELVHEALIYHWERLGTWLEEDRTFRAWQERLRANMHNWQASDEDEGALLRGAPLVEAEGWLSERGDQLGAAERGFVETSRATRDRRQAERERLRRRFVAVLVGGLILALILAAVAVWQGFSARQAQELAEAESEQTKRTSSQLLVSQALILLDTQPDLAMLLGVEANRRFESFETHDALLTILSQTPQIIRYLVAHDGAVRGLAVSPDGTTLATAGDDNAVRLWDIATGQPLGPPLTGHDEPVWSVAFSPDGQTLASGSFDNTIILWDVERRQPQGSPLTGHQDNVWSVAFSPDGAILASASADGAVRLWDAASGQPLGSPLTGHEGNVTSLAFHPDGKILASGGGDNRVILWNLETGEPLGSPLDGHTGLVRALAFSPDGQTLASGSHDGAIILWDVNTSEAISLPLFGHEDWVTGLAFSPDGQTLASAGRDKQVLLWDVSTLLSGGDMVGRTPDRVLIGHAEPVWNVAFTPGGEMLILGDGQGEAIFWDPVTDLPLGKRFISYKDEIRSIAYHPDGQVLASVSAPQSADERYVSTIVLWDIKESSPSFGQSLVQMQTLSFPTLLAMSPDGRMLAANGEDITLWDMVPDSSTYGQLLTSPLKGHTGQSVYGLAFSPDGRRLASSSSRGEILFWDVAPGSPTFGQVIGPQVEGHARSVYNLAFSPDGNILASAGADKTIRLWDARTGELLLPPLSGHERSVWTVIFSPDGQLLASVADNIILWDVATGQPLGPPLTLVHGNCCDVGGYIAFSPDGRLFATGEADRAVLWETTGNPASPVRPYSQSLIGHPAGVDDVTFSPDSRQLATAGTDHTIVLWDVDPDSWQQRACQKANRNLTLEEWQRFFGDEPYQPTCPDLPAAVE